MEQETTHGRGGTHLANHLNKGLLQSSTPAHIACTHSQFISAHTDTHVHIALLTIRVSRWLEGVSRDKKSCSWNPPKIVLSPPFPHLAHKLAHRAQIQCANPTRRFSNHLSPCCSFQKKDFSFEGTPKHRTKPTHLSSLRDCTCACSGYSQQAHEHGGSCSCWGRFLVVRRKRLCSHRC